MTKKLLHVEVDTTKVAAERLAEWTRALLLLSVPGNPINTVDVVQVWTVSDSGSTTGEEK